MLYIDYGCYNFRFVTHVFNKPLDVGVAISVGLTLSCVFIKKNHKQQNTSIPYLDIIHVFHSLLHHKNYDCSMFDKQTLCIG